jgi:hypothetical protein
MSRVGLYKFAIVLFLVIAAFITGIGVGNFFATFEAGDLNAALQNSELSARSYFLQQEISRFALDKCSFSRSQADELSDQLYRLGQQLVSADNASVGEQEFKLLKRQYHLLQVRTYLLLHELRESCTTKDHVVLYFYGPNNHDSFQQGAILDSVVSNFSVKVFAVEFNYSSDLAFLEGFYNITRIPTVVVDYRDVHQGLTGYSELASLVS